jgi:hypothetical protein
MPALTYNLADAQALTRRGFRPYVLATWHDPDGPDCRVELMSYPFPVDGGRALHIMARVVPDDPTTLRQVPCNEVEP